MRTREMILWRFHLLRRVGQPGDGYSSTASPVSTLRISAPPANREIDGIFEFDTDNLSVLFS